MRQLDRPLPIFKLHTTELRAQNVGGSPQGFARISFMTEDGIVLGDTTFSAWSKESWDLLNALMTQVEKDFTNVLSSKSHKQWDSLDRQVESPSIDFSQE